jgi:S1-C subfamily serine protease
MKGRILFLTALLAGGFFFFTSKANWKWKDLQRVTGISNPPGEGPAWSGPTAVAQGAGLSPDELNNIEIYKMANQATVNITSTVYKQTWFNDVYPAKEAGSGFVISADGRILTNNHVISGSQQIEVTMADHTNYKATVLARDPQNDLALLQIKATKNLPFLRLGDSEKLQVGQKVLAIGNPFRFDGTLTTGVVSALGRDLQSENRVLEGLVQTDAAINPGNSGGPLLNSQGDVIGINTAIYGANGGNIGIGFAMPINRGKVMLDDYSAGRVYKRPRLGVEVVYVAGDYAQALELPREGGLLVQRVVRGTAAESAGVKGAREMAMIGNYEIGVGGDFIVAIDGKPVDRQDALSQMLGRKRAGDNLDLTVYRGGKKMTIKVKLGEAPDERL